MYNTITLPKEIDGTILKPLIDACLTAFDILEWADTEFKDLGPVARPQQEDYDAIAKFVGLSYGTDSDREITSQEYLHLLEWATKRNIMAVHALNTLGVARFMPSIAELQVLWESARAMMTVVEPLFNDGDV